MTNWTVTAGSATLSIDTTVGFTGVSFPPVKQSLKVTCTGSGTVTVKYNPHVPVTAPEAFAWGFHCLGSNPAHTLTATLAAFNAGGTQVNTASDTTTPSATTWRPLSGATGSNIVTSTGPAMYGQLSFTSTMTAGDVIWIDTVGIFTAVGQVLVDFLNPAFGNAAIAGSDFVDLTGRVKFDAGLTITRGRQDNINDVQAGSATFTLQNDDGWFTPNCSSSPWYQPPSATPLITLGRRCQVNLTDETGKWHTRFDGPIGEIDYTLDNTANTNIAFVTVADVLAYLNRQDSLSCWTKEQILNEPSLIYHWTLDDSGGTGLAAESSGNGGPPLQLRQQVSNSFTWGAGAGGVETMANAPTQPPLTLGPNSPPLSSANFLPTLVPQSGQDLFRGTTGSSLSARIPALQTNVTGVNYTIEAWFFMDGGSPTLQSHKNGNLGPFTVLSLGESKTGYTITAGLHTQATGDFNFDAKGWSQPPSFTGTAWGGTPVQLWSITDSAWSSDQFWRPHHLVMTISGAPTGATLVMWVDGVNIGNIVLSPARAYDWLVVGSAYGGFGGWDGNISCVSIYGAKLSTTDISLHYNMGQFGMFGTTADNAISLLSTFSNMPPYWQSLPGGSTGLSPMEYLDITGSNALTAMQTYESAEKGLLYVNNIGQLVFHTRDWRMGYGAADLTLPSESYDADLGFSISDQFLINQAGVSSQVFGTGYFADNPVSDALYGDYANGTSDAPTSFPVMSFSPGYQARGIGATAYFVSPYMTDLADWEVNTSSVPYLKCSQVTVDLLSNEQSGVNALQISQCYALDIDNVITLGTPPDSMPTDAGVLDYFIEGISENISLAGRNIVFNTSPANLQRAWKPGDATYGVLGSTARIGISTMETRVLAPLAKLNVFDPGPPYFPPVINNTMNNPINNGHDFLGENDFRGINDLITLKLNPPICIVGQRNEAQSVASSSGSFTPCIWDWIYLDTQGGMGFVNGWPNWYCCLVPGYYDIDWSTIWAADNTGAGLRRSRLVIAQNAAQAVYGNTGDPTTVTESNLIDSEIRTQSTGNNDINQGSTRTYLGLGDMVTVDIWQNSGGAYTTGTDYNGGDLSLVWVGYSTSSDQVPFT